MWVCSKTPSCASSSMNKGKGGDKGKQPMDRSKANDMNMAVLKRIDPQLEEVGAAQGTRLDVSCCCCVCALPSPLGTGAALSVSQASHRYVAVACCRRS